MDAQTAATLIWFQQGYWPLVGAIAVLAITNALAVWRVVLQSRQTFAAQLALKRVEFLSEQLSGFYNPLYALLAANRHVFEKFGPQTFPGDHDRREAAASNWNAMRDGVILPNNEAIGAILRDRSHLVSDTDDIANYLDLNNHVHAYRVFVTAPTEAYASHQFPQAVADHLSRQRLKLADRLKSLKSLRDMK